MSRDRDIERAIGHLQEAELVAVPTETVYGLAADATNPDAVGRIFEAKGRPSGHPLIAHLAAADWLDRWTVQAPALAHELAEHFWPGPLTLILRRPDSITEVATGGLPTVAVRVPDHDLTRAIIAGLGRPIAAPSANRYGSVSPTTAEHVRRDLGDRVAFIVDGGPCRVGLESTIVDLTGAEPVIARLGGVTQEQLEEVMGPGLRRATGGEIRAPGTTASHYAPKAELRVVPADQLADTANRLADEGRRVGALVSADVCNQLSDAVVVAPLPTDLEAAARQLYASFRLLDDRGCEVIVAAWPEERGIGAAIADRLRRAAHRDR